jgi:hypothetical protein
MNGIVAFYVSKIEKIISGGMEKERLIQERIADLSEIIIPFWDMKTTKN